MSSKVEITAEDLLALLKIEAAKAAKEYGKDELGSCKEHLSRAQELILEIYQSV